MNALGRLAVTAALLCALTALASACAFAQAPGDDVNEKDWRFSAGPFIVTNATEGFSYNYGINVDFERYILRGPTRNLLVGFRVLSYDAKNKTTGNTALTQCYQLTANHYWHFGRNRRWYLGLGLGAGFSDASGLGTDVNFATTFAAGYEFPGCFVELRDASAVTRREAQGGAGHLNQERVLILAVGGRF